MGDETDNPVQACPGPCDAVIPIVYYNQPITIAVAAVDEQVPDIAGIDILESMRQTFTDPDSNPPLSIAEVTPIGPKVLGLGHAGVAFINGTTGHVSYYEYGRYRGDYGEVRRRNGLVKVGGGSEQRLTVEFGEDNNPTPQSFQVLLRNLTQTNVTARAYWATYTKLANGAYDIMQSFAERRITEVEARTADEYNVASNHCFTFAMEVAAQAGLNTNVSSAPDLEITLVGGNILTRGTVSALAPNFEVPARQMLVLQDRYRPLNVNSSGIIVGSFDFPTGLNSR